jgi:hypothetical protein
MFNNEEAIRDELNKLKEELRTAYRESGKKVSGEWEEGLEVTVNDTKGILKGLGYLAGRAAGKMPPIKRILKWVKDRGLKPFIDGMTVSQLARLIAFNIGKQGTNEIYHFKIYEEIVTPERIQEILDRISIINLQAFIDEITAEMKLLTKDL